MQLLKKWRNNSQELLSKLSKAFMLPVSVLPIAGLLLGIGGAIGANANGAAAQEIANFLKGMSGVIFGNLSILFGLSVGMAFTKKNAIYSGFMTIIAYLVFNGVQSGFIHYNADGTFGDIFYFHKSDSLKYIVTDNLGIQSLRTSIFGGVTIGAFVAYVMNRWSNIELPVSLSFFSGIRLVPMIIVPIAALFGVSFVLIWPWIGQLISLLGNASNKAPAGIDGFVYGALGYALQPFGLHHIVIGLAWQSDLGGSLSSLDITNAATNLGVENTEEVKALIASFKGNTLVGDQSIWNFLNGQNFNSLPTNTTGDSLPIFDWITKYVGVYPGRFMQDYPTSLGLGVGVGLAIIFTAKKEHRKNVIPVIVSAMSVFFLTGISEPLFFTFLFVAPLLFYGGVVPIAGLSYMLMKISGAHVGVGFARGLIDLIIYGIIPFQKGTHFWWAFIYALAFLVLSFVWFTFLIKKFNFATPGRNGNLFELKTTLRAIKDAGKTKLKQKHQPLFEQLVTAYGGVGNLESVTACATRLRITVKDPGKVNDTLIKQLGATAFISKGKASQAIFGGRAVVLAGKINDHYRAAIEKNG